MNKLRIVILCVALLVFGAGVGVGMVQGRMTPPAAPEQRRGPGDHIADELNLSPQQRAKMHEIWSGTMDAARKAYDDAADRAKADRDARLRALVPTDKLAAYDQVALDHDRTMDDLRAARKRAIDGCIEQTRAMLSPEQAAKYEEVIKRFDKHGKNKQR